MSLRLLCVISQARTHLAPSNIEHRSWPNIERALLQLVENKLCLLLFTVSLIGMFLLQFNSVIGEERTDRYCSCCVMVISTEESNFTLAWC